MANKLMSQEARQALDKMKYEIAQEFGVTLDGNTPARLNGAVGGEMVKRLVVLAETSLRR